MLFQELAAVSSRTREGLNFWMLSILSKDFGTSPSRWDRKLRKKAAWVLLIHGLL